MQTLLVYDGSFAGWLSAVFEVYERKLKEVSVVGNDATQLLAFSEILHIITDSKKAERVYKGLQARLSEGMLYNVYATFLSELEGIENVLLRFVRYVFDSSKNIESDFGNNDVLAVAQTGRKVWREKHRMEAFVRFRQMRDGLFYAGIEPDYNVLPLIAAHFKSRYADQDWLIYDLRRNYGLHYNKDVGNVNETVIEWTESKPQALSADILDDGEMMYQLLWKDYFKHTGIPARKNLKLHLRHVPARYWKHLTEKQ